MIITKDDVGRVVQLRNGEERTIDEVRGHGTYPIRSSENSNHWTTHGYYFETEEGEDVQETDFDIVDWVSPKENGTLTPETVTTQYDFVNRPAHYNHLNGVECIQVTEHFNFNRGNAIKYIWRAGHKGNEIEDLKKAAWYLKREIERLECANK